MIQTEAQLGLRLIGRVQVFDLSGTLVGETLDPIAEKIEQTIQKKQLRRVIINLQRVQSLDDIAQRKILACLLRPQRSLLFIPDETIRARFAEAHIPTSVKICKNEEEVAEAFGSFLFIKDKAFEVQLDESQTESKSQGLERRRSKRIRVAIPVQLTFNTKAGPLKAKAIATNVSQGGLFAEFLDLNAPEYPKLEGMEGSQVGIEVPPNNTFKDEMSVSGKIIRFEVGKKQFGVAIQFI